MRKSFACVAALLLSATMMSSAAISASAANVIVGTDENGAYMTYGRGVLYVTNRQFQELSGTDRILQYGDVVTEHTTTGASIYETDICGYAEYGDLQLEYLGTAKEYYADTAKELTVVETGYTLTLEDADGVVYRWSDGLSDYVELRGIQIPEVFAPSSYQVGDVVACAVEYDATYDNNWVILPLTPAPEHTPIKGDIDCNGTVNIMDVILLNRNLMVGVEISEQGMKNALTYTANDGIATQSDVQRLPDSVDALNILKYIVGLTAEL